MEEKAYAKLMSDTQTYFVQSLSVVIGRSSSSSDEAIHVDIDLGKSKTISRRHAKIEYDFQTRTWLLYVLGRNGLKVR